MRYRGSVLCWCVLFLSSGETAARAAADDLFLESELRPARVLVQAQAVYVLRLWQRVAATDLHLIPPDVRLADVKPLGPVAVHGAVRNGLQYRVHEQRWAILPFSSGSLNIPPGLATGRVVTRGEAFRLRAAEQVLEVRPQPPGYTASWLPAQAVRLIEVNALPESLELGQPFRWQLRIEADGVLAAQLPSIRIAAPGFAVYPHPAKSRDTLDREGLKAVREQEFEIVAQRSGLLQVSALRLEWWDVTQDAPRLAESPSRAIRITPRAGGGPDASIENMPPAISSENLSAPQGSVALRWILVAGALMTLLAAGVYISRLHARRRDLRGIVKACREGDPRATQVALLEFARAKRPELRTNSLGDLADCIRDPGLRTSLLDLERCLYGPGVSSWEGGLVLKHLGALEANMLASPRASMDRRGNVCSRILVSLGFRKQ